MVIGNSEGKRNQEQSERTNSEIQIGNAMHNQFITRYQVIIGEDSTSGGMTNSFVSLLSLFKSSSSLEIASFKRF